ncbi:phage replisome organizer N-terminal domain-containing protein [Aliarcobacter butzleri]|uniref:phage replisome organizer N-terminal domain-containing protein n=1 Tax=Aliarcobacter butzleri TaxID=28197 RepID=UPI001EDA0743|nr:phage replisome organizer N-terminal domain-containing protein [Aliarcobacter butzleri]MCG3710992.1 phage replisome organizer N-terminal domain-containing protein [Aliarcobacter butzleri]MCG3714346.1 phage replisome organizer N-terminal domain-containing protein [Aliarcobacter butzleri]MDN5086360.1 phage replisome organizer N-terminal domain-containing protein [Aliarcobacter butzleri]
MSVNKRFYWLKIGATFFDDLKIQKLRKIAGGDTFTCIYLKLMILSLKNDGNIYFESIFEDIEDELAIKLNETVENIKATLVFCKSMKMIEIYENKSLFFKQVKDITGSESSSAERVRKYRGSTNKNKSKVLHCNKNVTTEKEKELDNKKNLTKKSIYDLANFNFSISKTDEDEKSQEYFHLLLEKQIQKDKQKERLENLSQASKENEIVY